MKAQCSLYVGNSPLSRNVDALVVSSRFGKFDGIEAVNVKARAAVAGRLETQTPRRLELFHVGRSKG